MRIVVIGQKWNNYYNNRFMGGGEKVEHSHLKLLSMYGHEVHFITNRDSETCEFENVVTHRTTPAKYSQDGLALGKALNRRRNAFVENILMEVQPEVVVGHDDSNQSLNSVMSELPFPYLTFVHCPVAAAGGMAAFGYMESLNKLVANGHTTVSVSEASRREWFAELQKVWKYLPKIKNEKAKEDVLLTFNDMLHPTVMWEKHDVKPITNHEFVTIGRLAKQKQHAVGFKIFNGDLTLFTPHPKNDFEREYQTLLEEMGKNKILYDIPHSDIMYYLQRSKALVTFGYESFGLTAFEANSFGVPVLLCNQTDDHSILEACAPGREFGSVVQIPWERGNNNFKEFLKSYTPPSFEDRVKIRDLTWLEYNPENSYKKLLDLLNRTIERHKEFKPKTGVLDDFFS